MSNQQEPYNLNKIHAACVLLDGGTLRFLKEGHHQAEQALTEDEINHLHRFVKYMRVMSEVCRAYKAGTISTRFKVQDYQSHADPAPPNEKFRVDEYDANQYYNLKSYLDEAGLDPDMDEFDYLRYASRESIISVTGDMRFLQRMYLQSGKELEAVQGKIEAELKSLPAASDAIFDLFSDEEIRRTSLRALQEFLHDEVNRVYREDLGNAIKALPNRLHFSKEGHTTSR